MAVVMVFPAVLRDDRGRYYEILKNAGHDVRFPKIGGRQLVEHELIDDLGGLDACLAGSEPYTAAALDAAPQLRIVARCGVGYDTVDVAHASKLGKAVCYAPGSNHDSVAEHTFGLILGLARQMLESHELVATNRFKRRIVTPLRGKTLGIVGVGRIGKAVAKLGDAFGMTVIGCDPYVSAQQVSSLNIKMTTQDEVLSTSDFITFHTPLTPETEHLVNAKTLAQMKKGAFVINTSRGQVVDEVALRSALEFKHIAGAALDVFEVEPPEGSVMLDAPNVLLSPHVAGIDRAAIDLMAQYAAEAIVDLLAGRWPAERIVNEAELRTRWTR